VNIKKGIIKYRGKLLGLSGIERRLGVIEQKVSSVQEMLVLMQDKPTVQTVLVDPKTLLTRLFTGIKIYLDPQDISVSAHVAVDGVWEKPVTKAWLAVLKKNDTVLDVGANFGYFGILAGQFTDRKDSKVILFEANKNLIPYITKSLSLNWLNEHVKVENLAISDRRGKVKLNVLKDYLGSSSLHSVEKLDSFMHEKMQLEVAESMSVESTTIDMYCKENNIQAVDLIKMDIEGYEEKAYAGMKDIIKSSKNLTLFIEFTKDTYENPEKFYSDLLKDFGNVYVIDKDGFIIKPVDASYDSIINQTDDWVMPVFSMNPSLEKEQNIVV